MCYIRSCRRFSAVTGVSELLQSLTADWLCRYPKTSREIMNIKWKEYVSFQSLSFLITAKGRCESSSVRQRSPLKTAARTLARNTTTSVDKSAGKYSVCPNDDYKWFLEVIKCIKRNHYHDNIISKTRKTLINWGCDSPVSERRGAPRPLSPTEDARAPNTAPPLEAARDTFGAVNEGHAGNCSWCSCIIYKYIPKKNNN